jgi:hypothetical protein
MGLVGRSSSPPFVGMIFAKPDPEQSLRPILLKSSLSPKITGTGILMRACGSLSGSAGGIMEIRRSARKSSRGN